VKFALLDALLVLCRVLELGFFLKNPTKQTILMFFYIKNSECKYKNLSMKS
jgi:hypothetical protein